ncbi:MULTISPECIES: NrfD/PsrC family molybdoenzyme membrane anchor subunit [unclassified Siphonobacter]|uniref:NrfD/PsrC family molybdoenzyme membrane anchor subunit n=1 Tax=unclassified Siphonobacter TaxID=2635712 RepID=UPI000CA78F8C|nr:MULTISPECIES: NrfD/PsrC family molybdoenzyme membrane anchor subunit [unclassified Siphonobacter]MDQ1086471.1 Ni/Fe-hydrogenase subunit HybB-like protein [Siphonobacter sp. SORGH_AS_1065]MDR6196742.1 Ni/Fe-hydrogenase subunit HybB-like protein [Siphonobacter sp. SORGH_AS_0500]PKK36091.1 hydrogenase [Siphonobacter sp. SORGH_AS_0500]
MSHVSAVVRPPLVTGGKSYHDITEDVCRQVEGKPTASWKIVFGISTIVLLLGTASVFWTWWDGLGNWGLNKTVGWAWDITNFVWWVGIGHAGTLISAILLLFRQKWRTSVNRAAEAMTIFAVICAASFILMHAGRAWLAYWCIPFPNTYGSIWVNFNSPLVWDVFAISTYFSVSCLFWYVGLIPDLATIRDRAKNKVSKYIYGLLSMGWNGNTKTWFRYEYVSLILAGISTPLVLSVHTIVSFDFATSVIPGWHTTIFPPYFVAGAIFSGFAMVNNLLLIIRWTFKLQDYITIEHIETMNKIITVTGSIVGIAYITEFFIAAYSGVEYESYAFINRAFGPYWWAYWAMMSCNVITPQFFWVRSIRRSITWTFALSVVVNIGMWFERFVIIVTSLHRDYLPSSWAMFSPTIIDIGDYVFTFGLFFFLFLLFAKYLPVINMAEVKGVMKSSSERFPYKVKPNTKKPGEHVTE